MRLVHNDTNRQFAVDVDIQTKIKFHNLKIQTLIEILVEGTNSRGTFVNQIIDFCSLISHMSGNWQLKAIFGDLTRFKTIPKACPIEPGHFFVRNFTTDLKYFPMKIIPKMTLFGNYEFFTIIKKRRIVTSNFKIHCDLRYN